MCKDYEEEQDMAVTAEELVELQKQMKQISKDIPILKSGENDAIELDPKSPSHKEWYEGR